MEIVFKDEPIQITANKLIESTISFEQFDYKLN
jgi:hypothetical protein